MIGDHEMRARKRRAEKFEEMQIRARMLTVPEWRVLLALAYDGPQTMYKIAKTYNFKYPTVHRAMKSIKEIQWVKVVEKKRSVKNVPTKTYGLTREGLLWLLSKIPKTIHPSLADFSEGDSLGLRKTLEEKDISRVENLGTQNDVYLHLLLEFNVDRIAKNNTNLFPLIFENWAFYREIEAAQDFVSEFPETAFSTLIDYYHNYPRMRKLGTLNLLFTYNLCYALSELYAEGCANVDTEFKNDLIQKATTVFRSNPPLQKLFRQISKEIEEKLHASLAFIKSVRSVMSAHPKYPAEPEE